MRKFEKLEDPFVNSPCAIIARAFALLYPGKQYDAQLVTDIVDEEGAQVCGCTTIPEDPAEAPLVEISGQLRVADMPEIFAHELAHVATGTIADDHGPEFEEAFEAIHAKYEELADKYLGSGKEPEHEQQ